MSRAIRIVLIYGLLTSVVGGSLIPAGARSWPRSNRLVTFDLDPVTRTELRYWNADRIQALPEAEQPDALPESSTPTGSVDTAPVVSGDSVSPSVRAPVRIPETMRLQSLGDFETFEITNPSQFPYSTQGKIIAFDSPTTGWVCSGTIVSSQSESLVLTAAHCVVQDDGTRPTRILFIPGYRNGGLSSGPFGVWQASDASFLQGYLSSNGTEPNYEYDLAAVRVSPLSGMTIQDRVGARGYLFNAPATQSFQAFGYPADPPFDGEKLWTCKSQSGARLNVGSGPDMVSMGCDMTQGSSGGGWIVNDQQINSVVSIGVSSMPNVIWGPYFGSSAQTLWNTAGGGPGPSPDPDPDPDPDPTEPVTHAMSLTLKLSGGLVASGRVTAADGYLPCTRNAPVGILKKTSTGWKLISDELTDEEGKYRIKIPNKGGRYVAVSPEGKVDDLNLCSEAESPARRH